MGGGRFMGYTQEMPGGDKNQAIGSTGSSVLNPFPASKKTMIMQPNFSDKP